MKNIFTLFAFTIGLFCTVEAQNTSTVIVFAEDGHPFHLILNGVQQNAEPETNIRVEGLTQPYYSTKILFKEATIEPLEKKHMMVMDADGTNAEVTYVIKQDKKGRFKLKFYSAIPIASAPPAPAETTTVEYTTTPRIETSTSISVTETTTTTSTSKGDVDRDEISIDVNMGGIDVDMDVNVDMDGNMDTDVRIDDDISSSTTVTTTTTTTTTTTGMDVDMDVDMDMDMGVDTEPVVDDGQCYYAMSGYDFGNVKKSVSSKVHEEDKLTVSKQVSDANCLSSEQVRDIMKIFVHESTRLEFAQYAYNRVTDKKNYYMVNDAFQFDSSIDDLNEYIKRP